MLSKNKLKYVRSLTQKKYRDLEGVFLAEGPKVVGDLMGKFPCKLMLGTTTYLQGKRFKNIDEIVEIDQKELEQASSLKSPRDVIAVFSQTRIEEAHTTTDTSLQKLALALDGVQDPGNLGTIIRLADWYGIEDIYCSKQTADAFAPKVVQATMGAIARVRIHYVELADFIRQNGQKLTTYGTFLDGEDLYQKDLSRGGLLIMGNEGNGISAELEALVDQKLYIPNYPVGQDTSESLNVAVATAITCAEFRRQGIQMDK